MQPDARTRSRITVVVVGLVLTPVVLPIPDGTCSSSTRSWCSVFSLLDALLISCELGSRRCDMLKHWQDLFEFIALESPLRPILEHHDDAARRLSSGWIDFWSVAENIVRVEIEGFGHGFMVAAFRPRPQTKLRSTNLKCDLLALRLSLRPDDLACIDEHLAVIVHSQPFGDGDLMAFVEIVRLDHGGLSSGWLNKKWPSSILSPLLTPRPLFRLSGSRRHTDWSTGNRTRTNVDC